MPVPWNELFLTIPALIGRSNLFLTAFRAVGLWGTLNQVMKRFPVLYPLVIFALPPRLARVIPTILRENHQIVRSRVERRDCLPHPDYFSLLVKDDNDNRPSDDFLVAQANHLIVGGFDPDTNLFTSAVHFLLVSNKLGKLQEEMRGQFSSYSDITGDAVQDLPWLNAVIEESLRIHTNGAFGLPRISQGDYVDGHYIPKGVSAVPSFFRPCPLLLLFHLFHLFRSPIAPGHSLSFTWLFFGGVRGNWLGLPSKYIENSAVSKPPSSQPRTRSVTSADHASFAQSVGSQRDTQTTTLSLTQTTRRPSSPSVWVRAVASAKIWPIFRRVCSLPRCHGSWSGSTSTRVRWTGSAISSCLPCGRSRPSLCASRHSRQRSRRSRTFLATKHGVTMDSVPISSGLCLTASSTPWQIKGRYTAWQPRM